MINIPQFCIIVTLPSDKTGLADWLATGNELITTVALAFDSTQAKFFKKILVVKTRVSLKDNNRNKNIYTQIFLMSSSQYGKPLPVVEFPGFITSHGNFIKVFCFLSEVFHKL